MKISIKRGRAIEGMRTAGRVAAEVLRACREAVAPGVTTHDIEVVCLKTAHALGAESSTIGYCGFPGALCVSVNDEVIHGIPGPRIIRMGDIVSLDVTINIGGWHGDNAVTVAVGEVPPETQELLDVTQRALYAGIAAAKPGRHLSDISAAVEKVARDGRCGVVREFVGHGIGHSMHEEPQVANFGRPGRGPILEEGMTICIEPMFTRGSHKVEVLKDDWTVVTKDGLPAAHYEHTVLITATGAEILTPRADDAIWQC
ncbi:MAG: type I methionyl aminopeptidase [Kiritimatiellae bacterium]|nr:type I methionyl aminopeptidase [Kiritimatiellia bacterium]